MLPKHLPLPCLILFLTAALWAGPGDVGRTWGATLSVGGIGVEYRPLADWGRVRGFKLSRNPASRDATLIAPGARFELQVGASRVEFNKVGIWLSRPVQLVDNQVLVAVDDIRAVLDPLVQPPRLPAGKRLRTICLDPGHGGKEPGHRSGSRLEKTYTLSLAQEVRARLIDAGFTVVMTRRSDEYVDFPERVAIAARNHADLFVSLHFNATADGSSEASGVEVYAMTPEGARSTNFSKDVGSLKAWAGNEFDPENLVLAYEIQRSLLERLPGPEDRGVRRARFLVLRLAEIPAVLVEAGFMSNASDAGRILSETGRRRTAQAIVSGILAYRRQVERPNNPGTQRNTSSTSSTSNARPGSAKN